MAFISHARRAVLKGGKWFCDRKRLQQHRGGWEAAAVGRMVRGHSDDLLKFAGNCSLCAGFVIYALTSPLSEPVLSTASPTAPDFMMAVGLLIHVALKMGAWWEYNGSVPPS